MDSQSKSYNRSTSSASSASSSNRAYSVNKYTDAQLMHNFFKSIKICNRMEEKSNKRIEKIILADSSEDESEGEKKIKRRRLQNVLTNLKLLEENASKQKLKKKRKRTEKQPQQQDTWSNTYKNNNSIAINKGENLNKKQRISSSSTDNCSTTTSISTSNQKLQSTNSGIPPLRNKSLSSMNKSGSNSDVTTNSIINDTTNKDDSNNDNIESDTDIDSDCDSSDDEAVHKLAMKRKKREEREQRRKQQQHHHHQKPQQPAQSDNASRTRQKCDGKGKKEEQLQLQRQTKQQSKQHEEKIAKMQKASSASTTADAFLPPSTGTLEKKGQPESSNHPDNNRNNGDDDDGLTNAHNENDEHDESDNEWIAALEKRRQEIALGKEREIQFKNKNQIRNHKNDDDDTDSDSWVEEIEEKKKQIEMQKEKELQKQTILSSLTIGRDTTKTKSVAVTVTVTETVDIAQKSPSASIQSSEQKDNSSTSFSKDNARDKNSNVIIERESNDKHNAKNDNTPKKRYGEHVPSATRTMSTQIGSDMSESDSDEIEEFIQKRKEMENQNRVHQNKDKAMKEAKKSDGVTSAKIPPPTSTAPTTNIMDNSKTSNNNNTIDNGRTSQMGRNASQQKKVTTHIHEKTKEHSYRQSTATTQGTAEKVDMSAILNSSRGYDLKLTAKSGDKASKNERVSTRIEKRKHTNIDLKTALDCLLELKNSKLIQISWKTVEYSNPRTETIELNVKGLFTEFNVDKTRNIYETDRKEIEEELSEIALYKLFFEKHQKDWKYLSLVAMKECMMSQSINENKNVKSTPVIIVIESSDDENDLPEKEPVALPEQVGSSPVVSGSKKAKKLCSSAERTTNSVGRSTNCTSSQEQEEDRLHSSQTIAVVDDDKLRGDSNITEDIDKSAVDSSVTVNHIQQEDIGASHGSTVEKEIDAELSTNQSNKCGTNKSTDLIEKSVDTNITPKLLSIQKQPTTATTSSVSTPQKPSTEGTANASSSIPKMQIKNLFKKGDVVKAQCPMTKRWYKATVLDYHTNKPRDEKYGEIRHYSVTFEDQQKQCTVREVNVVKLEDYLTDEEYQKLSKKYGIRRIFDKKSKDRYAKSRGWFETAYTGDEIFSSIFDAAKKAEALMTKPNVRSL